eukprot:14007838-Alexandrium_andersonii.AAC.1
MRAQLLLRCLNPTGERCGRAGFLTAALLAWSNGHGSRLHSTAPVAVLRVDGLAAGEAARAQVDALADRADLELPSDRLLAAVAAHL